jgi:hypothetical protein
MGSPSLTQIWKPFQRDVTGKILLAYNFQHWVLDCDLNLAFIFHISSHVKILANRFSKMGPVLWNALVFIQRNFKVQCELAFCAWPTENSKALIYIRAKRFSSSGNFYSPSIESGMRMSEHSGVLWNFAYEKHVFYFLPMISSQATKQISNKFLKVQHLFLYWPFKVWSMDQQHQ